VSRQTPLPLQVRDYYTEFIEGSRWLRQEQAEARTTWYDDLPWEHKEVTLFRFEMLLKGLVCFGNPVNHPGPPRRGQPVVAREFDNELGVVRSVLRNIVETGRSLSGDSENNYVFQRYLESVIVQDHARIQIAKKSLSQDTPEQSLALLQAALENLLELTEGLSKTTPISYRLFSSLIKLAQREIHRSEYFDPLAVLEFRVEFDRLKSVDVLEVIRGIKIDPARRVASLTFLALFRMLRYLVLITEEHEKGTGFGTLFAFLALLRSDARALAVFLRRDAATWIAEGFGKLFEGTDPDGMGERYAILASDFDQLKSLRELLGSMGNQLRLELRRVYEQHLPALADVESKEDLNQAIAQATGSMKSFLQNAIVLLAREFDSTADGERLFTDFTSARNRSDRLRRDIWMFQQILRAFITKARGSADAADQWTGLNTFRFVREFVSYFKSMGYQLLRYSDYERFDGFMGLVDRLRDGDVLEVQRLSQVIDECEDFHSYLGQMFEAVSRREELKGVEFDRREAAKTLMLFLGH
jgi:hypothetical protein